MLKKTRIARLAMVLVMGAALSANAGEGVMQPNTLAAALAIPYLTTAAEDGERLTIATVTNGLDNRSISLHLTWISATDWSAIDYDCPLTPLETTYFIHEKFAGSDNALVTFECSDLGQDFPNEEETNNVVTRVVNGADGILFVAQECQISEPDCDLRNEDKSITRTLHEDSLAGDVVVIDFGTGSAFSAPAIHIQGVDDPERGNRNYSFDSTPGEYLRFPSMLTTTYIAPDDSISAELLLFTLDGEIGSGGGINAKLAGFAYDDDENPTSGSITFDCMTVAPIDGSPNGFGLNVTRPFGGHISGHLELYPSVVLRNDVAELYHGDGNGIRRPPVHGYLIQTISAGGEFAAREYGGTIAAASAWARQLTQGNNPLMQLGDDDPVLRTMVNVADR